MENVGAFGLVINDNDTIYGTQLNSLILNISFYSIAVLLIDCQYVLYLLCSPKGDSTENIYYNGAKDILRGIGEVCAYRLLLQTTFFFFQYVNERCKIEIVEMHFS